MSEQPLGRLVARMEELRGRLDRDELSAERATELLEQITTLAQEAIEELERQAEALEEQEPSP